MSCKSKKYNNQTIKEPLFNPENGGQSALHLGEEKYYFLTKFQPEDKNVVLTFATRVEEMSPNGEDTTVKPLLDKNNNPLQLHVPFTK